MLTVPLWCLHCASLLRFQQASSPLSKCCSLCVTGKKKKERKEAGHWCCTLWPRGRCQTTWVDGFMRRTYPTERSAFVCSVLHCGHMFMDMHGNCRRGNWVHNLLNDFIIAFHCGAKCFMKAEFLHLYSLSADGVLLFNRTLFGKGRGCLMQALPFARRGKDTCSAHN